MKRSKELVNVKLYYEAVSGDRGLVGAENRSQSLDMGGYYLWLVVSLIGGMVWTILHSIAMTGEYWFGRLKQWTERTE